MKIAKFLRTTILKNIYKRLLLIVIFKSNEEQHLLAKLDEMGKLYFKFIRFILVLLDLYSIQKQSRRCYLKRCF